ncbi:glutathione S-transferase 1-1-like isoform X1 [Coccinella septempunctata]|uniref:glutathione S-transferase 1-1-like isoform X1 n=1 Tax=Coccinella septempunctata TaxID=41139 RepID=UPI001D06B06E|nr:glutathione S-transferase 1-1-like isoform X1 [Coccinella septempunctata]
MAPILYMLPASPPVRAVLMTAKCLNIELEQKECNVLAGDQYKEEYLKLNPAHTVPTLVDDGVVIWESAAIMGYLVGKYGKDDSLYPKDVSKRAVIDQLLHFSTSSFTRLLILMKPIILGGQKKSTLTENQAQVDVLFQNLDIVEKILEDKEYLTGDNLTIADLSYVTWISTMTIPFKIEEERFPKVIAWWKRLEKLPCYEINRVGLTIWASRWAGKE